MNLQDIPKIKISDVVYTVFMSKDNEIITSPYNMCLEDSLADMFDDIGCYDYDYLKEVYTENKSFTKG